MAIQLYFRRAIETTLSAALPGKIVLIVLQLENLLDIPVLYSPSIIACKYTYLYYYAGARTANNSKAKKTFCKVIWQVNKLHFNPFFRQLKFICNVENITRQSSQT